MKEYAKGFYTSRAWAECREAYRKSVGGLCEACLKKGIITAGEIVHHIKPITPKNISNPDITLNWNNLRLLCRDCHAEIHKKPRRYRIESDGTVSPRKEE